MSTLESMSQTAKRVTSITMVEGEDLTGEELLASKQILWTIDQVSWTIPDKKHIFFSSKQAQSQHWSKQIALFNGCPLMIKLKWEVKGVACGYVRMAE